MFKNRLFFRFLGTYILLLLIPLVLGSFVNNRVVKEFEGHVQSAHLSYLHQTRDVIEKYIDEIEWQAFQIAGSTTLARLLHTNQQTSSADKILIKNLIDELNSYLLYSSSLNTTFYVYLKNPKIVLTPYAVYEHDDFSEDKTFFQMEGVRSERWNYRLLSDYFHGEFFPARTVTIEDFKNKEMIPYIQSIPAGYGKSAEDLEGAVVYLIGESEFKNLLKNIDVPPGGWVYIADRDDNIITSLSRLEGSIPLVTLPEGQNNGLYREVFRGREMFFIYTRSETNSWTYVAALPADTVLHSVIFLQRLSWLTLFFSLIIGIAVASAISYRRAEPIQQMIASLRNSFETEQSPAIDYKSLGSSINKLIERNQDMQKQLQRQIEFAQTSFLNRLLQGYFRNEREFRTFLSYLGFSIREDYFTVLLLSVRGYDEMHSVDMLDELNKMKVLLKEAATRAFSERNFLYDVEEDRLAILVLSRSPSADVSREKISAAVSQLLESLSSYLHSPLHIGIGGTYAAPLEVHKSYAEAREALLYSAKNKSENTVWYDEIGIESQNYYYPIELETRLLNAAKSGDSATVRDIFATIKEENLEKRNLHPEKEKYLFYEVQGTLLKVKNQLQKEYRSFKPLDFSSNSEENSLEELLKTYLGICDLINANKKSHNTRMKQLILEYIDKHYDDSNLGLCQVASEFSITESYLSYFFKEQTGRNFSAHIEELRIKKSTELLETTQLPIHEIAREVGYNSDKTFRRVFRRMKGMSPTEYRQEIRLSRMV